MWTSLCTNLCYPVEIKDIIIIIISKEFFIEKSPLPQEY